MAVPTILAVASKHSAGNSGGPGPNTADFLDPPVREVSIWTEAPTPRPLSKRSAGDPLNMHGVTLDGHESEVPCTLQVPILPVLALKNYVNGETILMLTATGSSSQGRVGLKELVLLRCCAVNRCYGEFRTGALCIVQDVSDGPRHLWVHPRERALSGKAHT